MTGETDLDALIRGLEPILDADPYVFVTVPEEVLAERHPACLGIFHEAEGVTLIVSVDEAERLGRPAEERWAHITLSIHSSLSAVGFMARMAAALARAGISLNPVAGFYHDHLFVPWNRRMEALDVLRTLARG